MSLLTHTEAMMTGGNDRLIVLANRAPFKHEYSRGQVVTTRTASGLVTALEPLLQKYSGTWVAHAAGQADSHVMDERRGLDVPPANPQYRIRYVSLPQSEYCGYYHGFANEGLWPLCHTVNVQPVFRRRDYEMYRAANTRFAGVVAEEAGGDSPLILVQDYHYALAPRVLRNAVSRARVAAFWHIPWPRPRTLRTCPWAIELLDGLLGSDVIGVQTDDDRRNLLGCVEALLDADVDVDAGTVEYKGRLTTVRAWPVGVDGDSDVMRTTPPPDQCRARICRELGLPEDVQLGIGVDRMDYTKGIEEKFLAVERLLECQPHLAGRFVFIQIAEPSRDALDAYRAARARVAATCDRINARFRWAAVQPIRLLEQHHEPDDVYRYYRAADLCYVGSLHDGMNLVAKEFVAARSDERGVLVLSEFAGAARQLRGALIVNPLRIQQCADALACALQMPPIEQQKRMRVLRDIVRSFDASWWANQLVHETREAATSRNVRRFESIVSSAVA